MPKVALQLREHDLPAEVLDFQACRDGLADELVVRFDFFIRCFYQYFAMLIAEAHEGLSLAGHFTDRQSAFIQGFTHVQEDDGVHYVTEDLSPHGVCGPLGQRQQPEILLAGLNDSFDISSAEVFCEQVDRLEFPVGKQHEVTEAHRHPVLLFILQGGVFLGVIKHVVALPLEGVVLIHINIGKDPLTKKFNLLPLAKVDVTSTDKTVFPFVQAGLELVVERLEREALPCRHPADKRLLGAVVKGVYHFLGYISGIQHKRVDCNVKAHGHVIHHSHYGIDVQDITGDNIIPDRETGYLVQYEDKPGLYGGGVNPMTTEGVERVVVNVVGKGRRVDVAALSEVGAGLPHFFNKCFEESQTDAVLSHHAEVCGITTERCRGDVLKHIGGERLLDEVVATYAAPVAEDAVQDMTQDAFPFDFIGECSLQQFGHSALDKKAKQEVRITEYGVDFGVRKNIDTFAGQASVIAADLVKTVGDGIIGHKSSAGGKEYSGFAVRSQPDDLPETFTYNLSGMELASILDVLRLLDGRTAAENIPVTVPHQFLNPYKCHIGMLYIVVLSSTTNLRDIFDNGKHQNYNLFKNQLFSKCGHSARSM